MAIRDPMCHHAVRHRDGQAGFTLIELVIVVGLIAILLAIFTAVMRAATNSFQLRRMATVVASELRRAQNSAVGQNCLLYTSPSPRDLSTSRMPSSA